MEVSPLKLVLALVIPLVLVLALGNITIKWLKRINAGQRIRDDGPQRHLEKEGTPTMGGILIVFAALLPALKLSSGNSIYDSFSGVWLTAIITFFFAAIGFADDWLKIKKGRSLGLKAREKLAHQFIGGLLFVGLIGVTFKHASNTLESQPLSKFLSWAIFWVPAIVATSNAINLADGLDGLASGLCAIAAIGIAIVARNICPSITLVALSLAGACLGFLWFNRHPARMFMGDVGSLGLGAALAGMAAWLSSPFLLIGVCLVPFVEEASVIAQVISFKTTGKRIFRMSPLHHHFELIGWSERRVVWTFWAVGATATAVTVAIYI